MYALFFFVAIYTIVSAESKGGKKTGKPGEDLGDWEYLACI